MSMSRIFIEENKKYQIDLSASINTVDDLHEKYQSIGNFLSDVDWIAETDDNIFLIEYKNTEIEKAQSNIFKTRIKDGTFYDRIIKKYYGGAFYILACRKAKPINYICIIEAAFLDGIMRKRMCASIKKRLPYKIQEMPEIAVNLINEFKVLSIQEWNEQYAMFPLTDYISLNRDLL